MILQSTSNCTLTTTQYAWLNTVGWVDESLYVGTLAFWMYNCKWLLIEKQRWHNEQIRLVYAFCLLILIARVVFLIMWKVLEAQNPSPGSSLSLA
jgi:hypothetical protein